MYGEYCSSNLSLCDAMRLFFACYNYGVQTHSSIFTVHVIHELIGALVNVIRVLR